MCILEDVYKSIKDVEILRGINIKLQKGTITALLGPNGAGKTSTIRIILGLLKPTRGTVNVFGLDVSKNPEKIRGRIGLLLQTNSGYRTLNGIQNINFILELSGKDPQQYQDDLTNLLNRLDLSEIANKQWAVLSGGEQRALGFIRAILCGDDFLLLDEPTTGLDLARAAIIRHIIQEQIEQGKTVLMSSHVLTDLEELAQKIIIIKNGQIKNSGTPAEIQNYYTDGGNLEEAIVSAFLNKKLEKI